MPIVVGHSPDAAVVGSVAFGSGQAERRDRLGQAWTQMALQNMMQRRSINAANYQQQQQINAQQQMARFQALEGRRQDMLRQNQLQQEMQFRNQLDMRNKQFQMGRDELQSQRNLEYLDRQYDNLTDRDIKQQELNEEWQRTQQELMATQMLQGSEAWQATLGILDAGITPETLAAMPAAAQQQLQEVRAKFSAVRAGLGDTVDEDEQQQLTGLLMSELMPIVQNPRYAPMAPDTASTIINRNREAGFYGPGVEVTAEGANEARKVVYDNGVRELWQGTLNETRDDFDWRLVSSNNVGERMQGMNFDGTRQVDESGQPVMVSESIYQRQEQARAQFALATMEEQRRLRQMAFEHFQERESHYQEMVATGRAENLTPPSIQESYRMMSSMLQFATPEQVIESSLIEIPGVGRVSRDMLDSEAPESLTEALEYLGVESSDVPEAGQPPIADQLGTIDPRLIDAHGAEARVVDHVVGMSEFPYRMQQAIFRVYKNNGVDQAKKYAEYSHIIGRLRNANNVVDTSSLDDFEALALANLIFDISNGARVRETDAISRPREILDQLHERGGNVAELIDRKKRQQYDEFSDQYILGDA